MADKVNFENSPAERFWLAQIFRNETFGGSILFITATTAVMLANSKFSQNYQDVINFHIGFGNLNYSIAHWSAELLLAIFFFVVGIELKHEIVNGSLQNVREASIPIASAIGGICFAALIFILFNSGTSQTSAWATPISTDVAFSIAVLSIFGKKLPIQLRAFLLTLAVVNDLIAILIVAFVYGAKFNLGWFITAGISIYIFWFIQHKTKLNSLSLIILGLIAWYATLQSGIHATVAGVALGLMMRVNLNINERMSLGDRVEFALRPFTAAICVPAFAFTAVGVSISNFDLSTLFSDKLALGIFFGFVIGQPLGIISFAYAVSKLAKVNLPTNLNWWDIYVVGTLAAIGFTVALLVSELSLSNDSAALETSKLAILISNVLAIVFAVIAIRIRTHFRELSHQG